MPLPAEMDLGLRGFLRYLQAERSASPYTVRNYGREVEEFLRFLASEGIQRWPEVGQEVLRRYLLWLASRGYARGSIARRVAEVHSFGAYLQREGWVARNPFVALEARAPKNKRRLPEVLGVAEAQVLVAPKTDGARSPLRAAQDLRDRAILEVLYAGGLRVSELVGLDLDDYDRHRGELRVLGKGNKERIALLGTPARTALQAYLQDGRPALAGGRRSAALFLNRCGSRLTARSVQSLLHQYTLQAGLDKRVTPHVLRHTFATHLLDGGADLRVVQELLGHAQLATTQIYTHVSRSQVRSVYLRSHPMAREGQAGSSPPPATSGEEKP